MKKIIALFVVLLAVTGCDTGVRQMGPTEIGVVFRKLPPALGGGVGSKVIGRGGAAVVWPWDSIYRFDTQVKEIEWGAKHDENGQVVDYLQTRALDGNEVALAVKIQYSVATDPAGIVKMIQEVATNEDEVRDLVVAVARADVRTYMNELHTADFFNNKRKFEGGERVKRAMQDHLKDYGITIESVNLGEHRFERVLRDGTIDESYQAKINEVQTRDEGTKREKLRKATVEADKKREEQDAQADVNRQIAEAQGYLAQAKLKGDGYYNSKANEAKAISASGKAQVDGMIEQINAFSGPGGRAMLKIELAKALLASQAKFAIVDSDKNASVGVHRFDTNQLLTQLGIIEGANGGNPDSTVSKKAPAEAPKK